MGILIFIMGFRSPYVGVDDFNYLSVYNKINSLSLFQYYPTNITEPGYYLLNRLVYLIFDDFQWVIVSATAITIFFFYKAIEYEIKNISLPLAIFIFSMTQYFYYFGIVRLGIAVSIIVFAYRYITEGKKKKFIFLVLIATLFHYSALFALVLLFIKPITQKKIKKDKIFKMALLIPLAFLSVKILIYPLITTNKYSSYAESTQYFSYEFIQTLPFLFLFLLYFNKLDERFKNYDFYVILYVIKLLTEMFAPIIGIGRMVWYINLSLCFLLPATIRYQKKGCLK